MLGPWSIHLFLETTGQVRHPRMRTCSYCFVYETQTIPSTCKRQWLISTHFQYGCGVFSSILTPITGRLPVFSLLLAPILAPRILCPLLCNLKLCQLLFHFRTIPRTRLCFEVRVRGAVHGYTLKFSTAPGATGWIKYIKVFQRRLWAPLRYTG